MIPDLSAEQVTGAAIIFACTVGISIVYCLIIATRGLVQHRRGFYRVGFRAALTCSIAGGVIGYLYLSPTLSLIIGSAGLILTLALAAVAESRPSGFWRTAEANPSPPTRRD